MTCSNENTVFDALNMYLCCNGKQLIKKISSKLCAQVFLISNNCESGADTKILFEKLVDMMLKWHDFDASTLD